MSPVTRGMLQWRLHLGTVAVVVLVATFSVTAASRPFAGAKTARSGGGAPAHLLAPAKAPDVASRAVLDRYCVTCHNQRLKTADVVLEQKDPEHPDADSELWERVIRKLQAGAMPPVGRPRPDPATYQALLHTLEDRLDRSAQATPNPGRPPIHRLNRLEYTNAIRDVFGLEIDGRTMLPADDSGYGFDNVADVLTISPGLLERYMLAATKISRLVVGDPTMRPGVTTYQVGNQTLGQDDRMSEDLPFGSRGGAAIRHYFPLDGEYLIKFALQHSDVADSYNIRGLAVANEIDVRVDRKRVGFFTIGGPDPKLKYQNQYISEEYEPDQLAETRVVLKAGPHVVGLSMNKDTFSAEGASVSRLPLTSDLFNRGRNTSAEHGKVEMTIEKVTITGPFNGKAPIDSAVHRRVFMCRPASPSDEEPCAAKILSTLARRAYRRPVTSLDVRGLLQSYRQGRAGATFTSGIETAIARMLVDVNFLFRLERDPDGIKPGGVYALSDLDLASRISFFLWSSIPDEELIRVAVAGQLRSPGVLEAQVRRMLTDPRASILIQNFFGQWLYLRNVVTHRPDARLFPEFDEDLRAAFQEETRLFLESQIREDRPAMELFTANYTFVNERLARHYGLDNVLGSHFRRVTFPDDSLRGGLLGQGGVLMVTSYADRTSVVMRGKYILQNLLGIPPPPPPPSVPPLTDTKITGSLRQRMELHRKNPACAACHAMIDPLGFALENFDGIGKFRTLDANTPIDASGALVDGTPFDGPVAFRKVLLSRQDALMNTLVERLLTYALGRGAEHYDMPAVRGILRAASAANYRWSAIISALVRSTPFQMRRAES